VSGNFLVAVAGFVMLTVVAGIARILYKPGEADRVLAAQLLGSGGIASLLLVGVARDVPAALDVALTLAMLGAFASITFVKTSVEDRAPAADGQAAAGGGRDGREGGRP
jgi:multicomponent Na+:H+ antiporter subunit F